MDYRKLEQIKKLVVIAMFSDDALMERFVLKGGSALDLIYPHPSGRSSIDVDLSMPDDFNDAELPSVRKRINDLLVAGFQEQGYEVIDFVLEPRPLKRRVGLPALWGGYLIEFKLVRSETFRKYSADKSALRRRSEVIGGRERKTFKVDISKYEYCDGKKEVYLDDYRVYVYSPAMIVAEKLRAICQQMPEYPYNEHTKHARARDFYDIWRMLEKTPRSVGWKGAKFREIIRKAFQAKDVPLDLLARLGREEVRRRHEPDFAAVRDAIPPGAERLRSFDYYFDYVVGRVAELEALWNK
ncbi:MAG: hypothetical protein C4523_08365 [Myxococcales bacterium]|nr:MAG: hypothetical protein C4523_08365 [Myxococcales bacterium]